MTQDSVCLLQARKGAEGANSPHRNQAVSGLLFLHQARSNISRVSSVSQGHGLHPEEAAEEGGHSQDSPRDSYASGEC